MCLDGGEKLFLRIGKLPFQTRDLAGSRHIAVGTCA